MGNVGVTSTETGHVLFSINILSTFPAPAPSSHSTGSCPSILPAEFPSGEQICCSQLHKPSLGGYEAALGGVQWGRETFSWITAHSLLHTLGML